MLAIHYKDHQYLIDFAVKLPLLWAHSLGKSNLALNRSCVLLLFYIRLHAKQREVYQKIKALSNKIQLRQRGVQTLRKSLNEIESQISDLDAAKEIAKQGKEMRKIKMRMTPPVWDKHRGRVLPEISVGLLWHALFYTKIRVFSTLFKTRTTVLKVDCKTVGFFSQNQ